MQFFFLRSMTCVVKKNKCPTVSKSSNNVIYFVFLLVVSHSWSKLLRRPGEASLDLQQLPLPWKCRHKPLFLYTLIITMLCMIDIKARMVCTKKKLEKFKFWFLWSKIFYLVVKLSLMVMHNYENTSYIPREWNIFWTPQLELIKYPRSLKN